MDIRIGNSITMKVQLPELNYSEYVHEVKCLLINNNDKPLESHPQFYTPTLYTIRGCGSPVYNVLPHNSKTLYASTDPEFVDYHLWPQYRGFGVSGGRFVEDVHKYFEQVSPVNKIKNTASFVFPAFCEYEEGDYQLLIITKIDNGTKYPNFEVIEYGVVFKLSNTEGVNKDVTLLISTDKTIMLNDGSDVKYQFSIDNDIVGSYLKNVYYTDDDFSTSEVDNYCKLGIDLINKPKPVTLQFPTKGALTVYSDPMLNNVVKVAKEVDPVVEIYNLIPGKTYWAALVNEDKQTVIEFSTSGYRRVLKLENAYNVRDFGGINTSLGSKIKYGMIYRSSHIDTLTEDSIEEAKYNLEIKAQLDLRRQDEDPKKADFIEYYANIPGIEFTSAYNDIESSKPIIKQELDYVIDCVLNNRPVILNCHWGAHRTGFISAMVEGVLGCSQSDIDKDFELTSFDRHYAEEGGIRRNSNRYNYKNFMLYIKNQYEGSLYKFVLDCGVSSTSIEQFRAIMIDDYHAIADSSQSQPQYYEITYSKLVKLRDDSSLVPGAKYRMIDYETLVSGDYVGPYGPVSGEYKSANHKFDLLLTATSNNTFDNHCKALKSKRDSYFDDCDLTKWDIEYDIDNNKDIYIWALNDVVDGLLKTGKGVIYRMIDEWNNDLPYDFKNIMFKDDQSYYFYTFNRDHRYYRDISFSGRVYNVTIKSKIRTNPYKIAYDIPKNDFTKIDDMNYVHNIYLNHNCYDNTFIYSCHNINFGLYCYNNKIYYSGNILFGTSVMSCDTNYSNNVVLKGSNFNINCEFSNIVVDKLITNRYIVNNEQSTKYYYKSPKQEEVVE